MREGWITLHRQIQNNPLWQAEKFTKGQAWIDLLMEANHKEMHIMLRGIKINLMRGQTAKALKTFARNWRWSEWRVRNFFNYLQGEGMITYTAGNTTTITTILNYEQYQNMNANKRTAKPEIEDYEQWTATRFADPIYQKLCAEEEITISNEIAKDHLQTISTFSSMKPRNKKEFYYSLMRHAAKPQKKNSHKVTATDTEIELKPRRKKAA